jgi:transposase
VVGNARDVKHLPGRPKTDRLDAVWLCKVAERQMLRSSFVPPPEIRRLRDVTRYRVDLIEARTAEKQRVEKLLEDAQIKLSVVASDIFGVSGRQMMAALIAGQTNPKTLAQLARGRMRTKLTILEDAFTGYFTDHHGFLLAKMLGRVDALSIDIAELEDAIEEMVDPFADAVERLDEIPGLGVISASAVIAEVGLDMTRFPTAAHLASWARFAPGVKESAGKKKGRGSTGHGNRYLARVLGEAAVAAARTDTFLGERYRRIARRRGKKKAVVAVGRSILVIIWHLLADPEARLIGAIGDVTGIWPLTHVGEYEGDVVAANIVGDARPANYEAVPRVTYTDPQAAAVGAVEAPYSATAPVSEVPKTATYTHAYAQSNGFLTLLSDGERLTGAYALGPEAGEWLQQATLAIRAHVPLEVLSDTIQPFLSFSGIYDAALMALRMEIADMPRPVRPMDAQMTGL